MIKQRLPVIKIYIWIPPASTQPQMVGVKVPIHLQTAPNTENPFIFPRSNNAVKNITDMATFCANAEYMDASVAVSQYR